MTETRSVAIFMTPTAVLRRSCALLAGALLVALGAQLAVPLPGTPVPITFQVPAVLIVGGLLGPRLGALSLGVYLLAGISGLPVFAPVGPPGLLRLIGPTGGYLLACPAAAAVVGAMVAERAGAARLVVALVAGAAVIHLGGVMQLVVLTGDLSGAIRFGSLPFLVGDVLKLLLAGLVIGRYGSVTRARL